MAKKLNPDLTFVKSAGDIPTESFPSEAGYFFYYDNGILKKAPLSNIHNMVQGIEGVLKMGDPAPTVVGKYELADIGDYANLTPVILTGETEPTSDMLTTYDGFFNAVYFDGTNFIQIKSSLIQPIENAGTFQISRSVVKGQSPERINFPLNAGEKIRIEVSNILKVGSAVANVAVKDSNGEWLVIANSVGGDLSDKIEEKILETDSAYIDIWVNANDVTSYSADIKVFYGTAADTSDNTESIEDNTKNINEAGTFILDYTLNKAGTYAIKKNVPVKKGEKLILDVSNVVKTGTGAFFVAVKDSNENYLLSKTGVENERINTVIANDADFIVLLLTFEPTIGTFTADAVVKYGTNADSYYNTKRIEQLEIFKADKFEQQLSVLGTPAIYQAQKLFNVKIKLYQEYKDAQFYIIQCGWFNPLKRFLFDAVLIKNGVNIGGDITFDERTAHVYPSIPLDNEAFTMPIKNWDGKVFGEISFTYDWETINGDTTDHLLNVAPSDYLTQHIQYTFKTFDSPLETYLEKLPSVIEFGDVKKYGMKFPNTGGQMPLGFFVSIYQEPVTNDGFLSTFEINATKIGKYTIGIGHLDQRGWYIETSQFDINTTVIGINRYDLLKLGIEIKAGDRPFIYTGKNSNETIYFETYGSAQPKQLIFGQAGEAIHTLEPTDFGGGIHLYYEIKQIDTLFASKTQVANVQKNVESVSAVANSALQNNGKVKDRDGNLYRMVLDLPGTGDMLYIPMQFERVLVVGNSVTIHGELSSIGWYGNNRGMASTTNNNDFVHILETALKKVKPGATVTRQTAADGGTSWEQTLSDTDATFDAMFSGILANTYDLIVFRLSENVTDLSTTNINKFIASSKAMIRYLWSKFPNCETIITSNVMEDSAIKNSALSTIASDLSLTYVSASAADKIYQHRTDDWQYAPYFHKGTIDGLFHIIQKVYYSHPNDAGMLKVANAILGGLGYDPENTEHNVVVTTSKNVAYLEKGVYQGIITVLGYDSVPTTATVKDAANNNIPYTIRNMAGMDYLGQPPLNVPTWALYFEMPNSNVTITI